MTNTTQTIDLPRLKQAMSIMDLAKSLGLEIKGQQARCYNSQAHKHNDRSFSLGLDINRNRYKCFACGEGGSIIDLFMAIKGIDLRQAIKELAEMTGLTPMSQSTPYNNQYAYKDVKTPPEATSEPKNDNLEAYSELYEEFCYFCAGLDEESENYLKGRGLTQETLDRFLLFSVKDYQATQKHLKEKFSKDELQRAGVIGEKGNLIFYKHKIIIPFLQDGRIIFLQGRRLDQEEPRYLNLIRPVPLYNTDALAEIEKGKKIYIAEGVFDAIMLEQNNYKAVGILGVNNFKPDYTELFKGLDVVLALDNDEAGERKTKELAKMFLFKGQQVNNKQLPDGIKDITDYFIKIKDKEIIEALGLLKKIKDQGIYIDRILTHPTIEIKNKTNRIFYSTPSSSMIGEILKKEPNRLKPDEDFILRAFDYSQEEPSLLLHYLKLNKLYIFKGSDIYLEATDLPRDEAKTLINKAINGGIVNNKGEFFVALNRFREIVKAEYKQDGFITTIAGRKLYLDEAEDNIGGKVLNRKIQGSASDLHIKTLIRLEDYLKGKQSYIYFLNTDEFVIALHKDELDEELNIEQLLNGISKEFNLLYNIKVKKHF